MIRAVVFASAVVGLGLWGVAEAADPKPAPVPAPKPILKQKLDPAWAQQLSKVAKQNPPSPKLEQVPNFAAIKRLTLQDKTVVLKAAPEQITGPLRYSARDTFHDEQHYLELVSNAGTASVRPLANYFMLSGPDAAFAETYTRPEVMIHFQAQAGRRYLLECAVDLAFVGAGTVSAMDTTTGVRYSVSTTDKATLLFLHEATAEGMTHVRLTGDRPWYLDGCELSWT